MAWKFWRILLGVAPLSWCLIDHDLWHRLLSCRCTLWLLSCRCTLCILSLHWVRFHEVWKVHRTRSVLGRLLTLYVVRWSLMVHWGAIEAFRLSLFSSLTEERFAVVVLVFFSDHNRAQFMSRLTEWCRHVFLDGLLYSRHCRRCLGLLGVPKALALAQLVPAWDYTLFHLFKAIFNPIFDSIALEKWTATIRVNVSHRFTHLGPDLSCRRCA